MVPDLKATKETKTKGFQNKRQAMPWTTLVLTGCFHEKRKTKTETELWIIVFRPIKTSYTSLLCLFVIGVFRQKTGWLNNSWDKFFLFLEHNLWPAALKELNQILSFLSYLIIYSREILSRKFEKKMIAQFKVLVRAWQEFTTNCNISSVVEF